MKKDSEIIDNFNEKPLTLKERLEKRLVEAQNEKQNKLIKKLETNIFITDNESD